MSSIQEIKALVNAAEQELHIAKDALQATQRDMEEAYERNRIATATHDALAAKLENVKSQFREQIMQAGLRESNRWNEMYYKLLEWKEENDGDMIVSVNKNSDEETKKLSRWVINQRSSYKYFMNGDTKHIKDHRIDALNKIGFIWSVADHVFQAHLEELKQYHAENDTFDVPVKENKKLAAFVSRVRTAYANKQEGRAQQDLTDRKIEQLNAIGFKWELKKKSRKRTSSSSTSFDYDSQIALLREFELEYGHIKVNKLNKEWQKGIGQPSRKEYRRLSVFLTYARKEQLAYVEGQPTTIDEQKIKALEDLGVDWKMPASVPRKSTGGEATRKKKPKIEAPSRVSELYGAASAELEVDVPLPPLIPTIPPPSKTVAPSNESTQDIHINV